MPQARSHQDVFRASTSGELNLDVERHLERRQHARYRVAVPVNFMWKDAEGIRHRGRGFTRDVCAGGVFVLTETSPALDKAISIHMILPSLERNSTMWMRAEGRVVRVEPAVQGGVQGGFAASSKSIVLRNHTIKLGTQAK